FYISRLWRWEPRRLWRWETRTLPYCHRLAAAGNSKLPILDSCAFGLEIGSQIVKPLSCGVIRSLFETVVQIIRRYALVVERRLHREIVGIQSLRQWHFIPDYALAAAARVIGIVPYLHWERLVQKLRRDDRSLVGT